MVATLCPFQESFMILKSRPKLNNLGRQGSLQKYPTMYILEGKPNTNQSMAYKTVEKKFPSLKFGVTENDFS